MDGARSVTVRLDAAGPELTPRTLSAQLGRITKGELNTVLATVTALEPPQPAITAINEWWKIDRALDRGARVATSVEQVRQTVAAGDLAVVLHFQGSAPLGGQVEMVDTYARLGVRVIQLTYNYYPRPPWTWPVGISWWEDATNIAPALRRRGFSDDDVTGIMGENFMRAFEQTWDS